jgi:hypothetical protein
MIVRTESASPVNPNVGWHDQEEVDSGRVVSPAGGEDETESDSETSGSDSVRTVKGIGCSLD